MNENQRKVQHLRQVLENVWPTPSIRDCWDWIVIEVGELGDVLKRLGFADKVYARNHQRQVTYDTLADELGDVYLMLITQATLHGVDMDKILAMKIDQLLETHGDALARVEYEELEHEKCTN